MSILDEADGLWHYDELSGSTAVDSSGNGNDLTLVGSPTVVVGKSGKCRTYNGASGADQRGDKTNPSFVGDTQGTISAWFKNPASSGIDCIFGMGDTGIGTDAFVALNAVDNDHIFISARGTVGGDKYTGSTPTSSLVSGWNHVVWTMSVAGPPHNVVWLNGVKQTLTYGSPTVDNPFWFSLANASFLTIGARNFRRGGGILVSDYFDGEIDEVAYWSERILTDAEIGELYTGISAVYMRQLRENVDTPNTVLEIELDSGTRKFGFHAHTFTDVTPALKSISSLQNKIDTKKGFSTRGQIQAVLTGRDIFKDLIASEYLKNRQVVRREGYVADGFSYLDYIETFRGKILDWTRKGDDLTLTIADELYDATHEIPEAETDDTQTIDYRNANPVDIMTDIIQTQLGVDASYVDIAKFESERDTWLNGWVFDRVLTEPKKADQYLNELQVETNSFIIHTGSLIGFQTFTPVVPGQTVEEWTDNINILLGSLTQKGGYRDNFYNRIFVYYDYDESGSDSEENFESAYVAMDSDSQSSDQWDETKTKTIKSKWIRSYTYTQPTPSGVTGVTLYHVSTANGAGSGTLTFNQGNNTLAWTPPDGLAGETVVVDSDGKYTLEGPDTAKYIRVVVNTDDLATDDDKSDAITISTLSGSVYANYLANRLLVRYRDPMSTVSLKVDRNNLIYNGEFLKPGDLKDLTTDEAFDKGANTWSKERVLITSVRPDPVASTIQVEVVQAQMKKRYGFIAPSGQHDYDDEDITEAEKEYAYIGDDSGDNLVDPDPGDPEDGYYIW